MNTVFYFRKRLTRSRVVWLSVTEVTNGSDRGILVAGSGFPRYLRMSKAMASRTFRKPGNPGHDKAKALLDDEHRRYRLR
jgi:hypothetical protein